MLNFDHDDEGMNLLLKICIVSTEEEYYRLSEFAMARNINNFFQLLLSLLAKYKEEVSKLKLSDDTIKVFNRFINTKLGPFKSFNSN